jgi:hypothetical protein
MPVQNLMQQRRGTAAEWLSANPVLSAGEMGVETDTLKFKIGDGVLTWDVLKYAGGGGGGTGDVFMLMGA